MYNKLREGNTLKPTESVTVEIPIALYNELIEKNIDINEVIISALKKSIKIKFDEEQLKKGYEEMSEINLGLAKMCLEADNEALEEGERYLTECE